MTAERGYDPGCPLPRPHGHHWNGLGQGATNERECHGEPTPAPSTPSAPPDPCPATRHHKNGDNPS
jgi:hypothetical protein